MQPFCLTQVIGRAFVAKFDGEILCLAEQMTLSVGDVFFTLEGKNAWLILNDKEQVDVLDHAYLITTQGNEPITTNHELIQKNEHSIEVKAESLVKYGLTNSQAKALVLTRYQDYLAALEQRKIEELPFIPQVYRIAENQRMSISIDELFACVQNAKSEPFVIDSVSCDDASCDIIFDAQHLEVTPQARPNEVVKIQVALSNSEQQSCGDLSFVIQPASSKAEVKLTPHTVNLGNINESQTVAEIECIGFNQSSLQFQITNDPNHYFFTIRDSQLIFTQEGVAAIENKTLLLDEIEITIQATDEVAVAKSTIQIPIVSAETTEHAVDTEDHGATSTPEPIEIVATDELIKKAAQAVEPVLETKPKAKVEKILPVDPEFFKLDDNNLVTEHINNFEPAQDSINLTAVVTPTERKHIGKHLNIEKDDSGCLKLNISPVGDGKINTQFIFENIKFSQAAKLYDLNISELSEQQASYIILDSMLQNANLIVADPPQTEPKKR